MKKPKTKEYVCDACGAMVLVVYLYEKNWICVKCKNAVENSNDKRIASDRG